MFYLGCGTRECDGGEGCGAGGESSYTGEFTGGVRVFGSSD